MSRLKKFRKDQIILYQGEATPNIYKIKSGLVKCYTTLDNGNEAIISLFGPGDYFPVVANIENLFSYFYHETMDDTEVELLRSDDYAAMRDKPGMLNEHHIKYLGALFHVNALVQPTAYEKLAHTLRYLAIRFGEDMPIKRYRRVKIKLTQQILANIANISRETASLELNKLKKQEIIIEKNKFYLVDLAIVTTIIGDDIDSSISL